MTPEQRQRALRHYEREAAVALRIEQLEAALTVAERRLTRVADALGDGVLWMHELDTIRAALAKAGASHE
jgi:multidrug resistance efflux pump